MLYLCLEPRCQVGWSSEESLILEIVLFFLGQYYRGFTRNCCPMLDNFMQIVKENKLVLIL